MKLTPAEIKQLAGLIEQAGQMQSHALGSQTLLGIIAGLLLKIIEMNGASHE